MTKGKLISDFTKRKTKRSKVLLMKAGHFEKMSLDSE